MTAATAERCGLPHTAFLERLADASSNALEARLGQGAFLALRLVDAIGPDAEPLSGEAFRYQHRATERCCRALPADCTEAAHLVGLVQSAADAFRTRDVRLLIPALLAYALHLEDGLRLAEALDALNTVLRLGDEALPSGDRIATRLQLARVLRKLNRFDEADAAYAGAHDVARGAGDFRSALLSQLGRAVAIQGRGNLGEAEMLLRQILKQLESHPYPDLDAGTRHALGTTLALRGQIAAAILEVWRAFELYEDEPAQLRALNDTGVMLLALGRVEDAEHALREVIRRGGARDNVSNALIELMHCASYRRDRVAFERRRAECESRIEELPPNIRVDFGLKAGIGYARFGNFRKAQALMTEALNIAERHGLHEFQFRIERITGGLRDCETAAARTETTVAEPILGTQALEAVSTSLAKLGT